jgi:hypothetical protein
MWTKALSTFAIEWIKSDPEAFKSLASKTLEKPIEDVVPDGFDFVSSLQSTFEKPPEEPQEPDETTCKPNLIDCSRS